MTLDDVLILQKNEFNFSFYLFYLDPGSCPQSASDSTYNLMTADLTNFVIKGVTVEGYIDTANTTGGTSLPVQPTNDRYNLVTSGGKKCEQ